ELDPNYAPAHNNLGNALSRQGKVDEAIAAYRKAIENDPKLAGAHYNLGTALGRQGKLGEAIAEFRKAIELDPKSALAHCNLGIALSMRGNRDEALAELRKAVELDPKLHQAHGNLALLLAACPEPKLRDPRRAVESATKAVELAPNEGAYWYVLGVARYCAGDWKEALAALEKSRALRQGGDAFDYFFLAMAHWKLGAKDEARKWYDKAVEWMDKNAKDNDELRRFRR